MFKKMVVEAISFALESEAKAGEVRGAKKIMDSIVEIGEREDNPFIGDIWAAMSVALNSIEGKG